ncbi:MAG: 4-hydroxy-tetrahydrodipicolinate synthase [Rhodothalassiaceae bacterium]
MFKGSLPALITPFNDGAVDVDALRALVRWQMSAGSHGLVPCGTTGEAPVLNEAEQDQVLAVTLEAADGRVPVIMGCGGNDTAKVIKAVKRAAAAGADAALVVAPYYNKPDQAGLFAHFRAVAEQGGLPIVIYNIPGRSVVDIAVDTLARLAELPRIVAIKDATGDLSRVADQRLAMGATVCQLSGEDATAVGFNAMGGVGCISVTANVAPDLCAQQQEACLAGDYGAARHLQDRLIPLHRALFCAPSPAPVKYALARLGWIREGVRLPLVDLAVDKRRRVDAALVQAGLLDAAAAE